MGYFNQRLKPLLDEFKTVFDGGESSIIVSLLEEECTVKSVPDRLMNLIRLNQFLLSEYQKLQQVVKEERIHDFKHQRGGGIQVRKNENDLQTNKEEISLQSTKTQHMKRKLSNLKCVPLEVVATTLSHLPASNLMSAAKYGNLFVLKAAARAIKNYNIDKLDVSAYKPSNFHKTMIVRCKEVAETIKSMHFNETIPSTITKAEETNILKTLKHCINLQNLEFQNPIINNQGIIGIINRLTTECKQLDHLQFSSMNLQTYGNKDSYVHFVTPLFQSLHKIHKITLKTKNAEYEYRR